MVTGQNIAPPQTAFPTPTQALGYGFRFFRENIWIVVIFAGLAAAASSAAVFVVDRIVGDNAGAGAWLVAIIAGAVLAFAAALFRLVLIRRTLDYWDETQGRVAPRPFAVAVNTAVQGAEPRTLPYIGWTLLWSAVFAVVLTAAIGLALAFDSAVGLIILLVELVLALVFLLLTNFFLVAAADGPGNPLARSFHVFKGHVLRVVGTYLLYDLVALAIVLPIAIVVTLIADSNTSDAIAAVVGGVVGLILGGAMVGSDALMYRAVYGPAAATDN